MEVLKADTTKVSSYVAKSKLRRVDHYSRMALLAAGRALENVSPAMVSRQHTGLIIATGFGALNSTFSFLDSYLDQGDKLAAPTWFSGSVHNAAAAYISICYGLTGPCLTVSQFDLSFASALLSAQAWLNTGRVDAVLIGAVDEWCDVSGYCIQKLNTHTGKMKGSFGEGASFFLITRETDTVPAIGFLDNIYLGRDLIVNSPDMDDIIFSPCAAHERCNPCSLENNISPDTRLRKRVRAGSPTDMGMDVWFALSGGGYTGEKTCCIKQGANQMFGSVTAIKAH
ncbi:beta-ketoacyl synthase N-terminal-like domain-containing protein [uncultured Desulfobacter sp.]|uniref:beta-ketoacyl synthase N-terminal-like domain-containing protein n=1 Tax=uncultured Desulfobacter sp. TaxID=240139 RepID=UPI002AAB55B4|nr:beta-ketoacyl synthase N-terminal-like domain-containing protein [uncultured Desulfobacter sp.]